MDKGKKLLLVAVAGLVAYLPLEAAISNNASIQSTNSHDIRISEIATPYIESADQLQAGSAAIGELQQQISSALPNTDNGQQAAPNDITAGSGTQSNGFANTNSDVDTALKASLEDISGLAEMAAPGQQPISDVDGEIAAVRGSELEGGMGSNQGTPSAPGEFVNGVQQQLDALSAIVGGSASTTSGKLPGSESPAPEQPQQPVQAPAATPTPVVAATPAPTAQPEPPISATITQPGTGTQPTPAPDIDHEEQDIDDNSSKLLDIVAIPPAPTPAVEDQAASQIEKMIEIAVAQAGKPYVRGGKGPNNFDCSGFVFYALNQSGYKINYMTSASWAKADFPTINSIDEMKRGDIICLRGHVAIYLGDGIMVDASSSNRKIVVRDVGGWCRRNFISAKRVFTENTAVQPKEEKPILPIETIEIN